MLNVSCKYWNSDFIISTCTAKWTEHYYKRQTCKSVHRATEGKFTKQNDCNKKSHMHQNLSCICKKNCVGLWICAPTLYFTSFRCAIEDTVYGLTCKLSLLWHVWYRLSVDYGNTNCIHCTVKKDCWCLKQRVVYLGNNYDSISDFKNDLFTSHGLFLCVSESIANRLVNIYWNCFFAVLKNLLMWWWLYIKNPCMNMKINIINTRYFIV